MEQVSDERLADFAANEGQLGSIARELQCYRAAGPLSIELRTGQRWENEAGWSYTIATKWEDQGPRRADYLFVGDRTEFFCGPVRAIVATLRDGNYRLVAGPGSERDSEPRMGECHPGTPCI